MNIQLTYEDLLAKVKESEIQEEAFRTVIKQVENLYSEIAATHSDIEKKNLQIEKKNLQLVQEVAERKRIEAYLRQSETKYHTLYDSSADAVMLFDEKGFVDCNKATLELFGCATQEEFCSCHSSDLSPMEQPCGTNSMTLAKQRIATALEKGSLRFEWEYQNVNSDKTFPAEVLLNTMELDGKQVVQAVVRDISDRRQAEIELHNSYTEVEEANRRLQKLDQLKSDFLSSVSHELRTPLTSIRGFAHLVEREFSRSFAPLAEEAAGLNKKSKRILENLRIILKESDRLTRLVNDVLDLAKIEAGRVEWRDAPMQLAVLVSDAVNAARGMFDQKPGVELKVEVQDELPLFVGDADRVLQVLVNLLNNAAKFTDQGAVTVQVFLSPENLIQIDITDSGIGFPPEEAEAIFDKFQQAKHGDTLMNRPKGSGLGLAISREIVERHGGKIRAQSQQGKGSVFTVLLPSAFDLLNKVDLSILNATPSLEVMIMPVQTAVHKTRGNGNE